MLQSCLGDVILSETNYSDRRDPRHVQTGTKRACVLTELVTQYIITKDEGGTCRLREVRVRYVRRGRESKVGDGCEILRPVMHGSGYCRVRSHTNLSSVEFLL